MYGQTSSLASVMTGCPNRDKAKETKHGGPPISMLDHKPQDAGAAHCNIPTFDTLFRKDGIHLSDAGNSVLLIDFLHILGSMT